MSGSSKQAQVQTRADTSANVSANAPASTRTYLDMACNIFLVVFTAFAWAQMCFGWGNDELKLLTATGMGNLKFFTVLSNLFSGLVSLFLAGALIRQLRGGKSPGKGLLIAKYAATTSVALTFFMVLVMFTPLTGMTAMYSGANFWFHGVLPVVAMLEFCLLDEGPALRLRTSLWALLPTILYGTGYYGNILINGLGGEWPNTNDFYGFAAWGMDKAPFVFAAILLSTWILALVLRAPYQRRQRKQDR